MFIKVHYKGNTELINLAHTIEIIKDVNGKAEFNFGDEFTFSVDETYESIEKLLYTRTCKD